MPLRIELDLAPKLRRELRTLGARPDEAHVAEQDVDDLGDLVDPQPADQRSDPGDAGIVSACPYGLTVAFRIDAHAPELQDLEWSAVLPRPQLPIQHGFAVLEVDGERRDQGHGRGHHQDAEAHHHVEKALAREAQAVAAKAIREDEPARVHQLHGNPTALALEEREKVGDIHAAQPTIQQLRGGEAGAAVVHRHDDLLDLQAQGKAHDVAVGREDHPLWHLGAIPGRANVADDAKAALVGAPAQALADRSGARPGTPYQHAPLEDFLIDGAYERVAGHRQGEK